MNKDPRTVGLPGTKKINDQDYVVISKSMTSANADNELLFIPIIHGKVSSPDILEISLPKSGKVSNPGQALTTRSNNLFIGRNTLWVGSWHDGVVGIPFNAHSGMPELNRLKRFEPDGSIIRVTRRPNYFFCELIENP